MEIILEFILYFLFIFLWLFSVLSISVLILLVFDWSGILTIIKSVFVFLFIVYKVLCVGPVGTRVRKS